ncbi:hypothetical protein Trydic_g15419, partial [Trypoxylus dichotomus]
MISTIKCLREVRIYDIDLFVSAQTFDRYWLSMDKLTVNSSQNHADILIEAKWKALDNVRKTRRPLFVNCLKLQMNNLQFKNM